MCFLPVRTRFGGFSFLCVDNVFKQGPKYDALGTPRSSPSPLLPLLDGEACQQGWELATWGQLLVNDLPQSFELWGEMNLITSPSRKIFRFPTMPMTTNPYYKEQENHSFHHIPSEAVTHTGNMSVPTWAPTGIRGRCCWAPRSGRTAPGRTWRRRVGACHLLASLSWAHLHLREPGFPVCKCQACELPLPNRKTQCDQAGPRG